MANSENEPRHLEPATAERLGALVTQILSKSPSPAITRPIRPAELWREIGELRQLRPALPATVTPDLLQGEFSDGPDYTGPVVRGVTWAVRALQRQRGKRPRVSVTVPFTTTMSSFYSNVRRDWTMVHVARTAYEGSLTVNGKLHNFSPDQAIITASAARANEDGRGVYEGVDYVWLPHLGYEPKVAYTNGAPEKVPPYTDPTATPAENFMRLLRAVLPES